MKANSNPFTQGLSKQAFGVVATTDKEGNVVYRAKPKKGNQGKDAAHLPAQSRARVVGKMLKGAKGVIRNSFTNATGLLYPHNLFQRQNMDAANAVVDVDGEITWENAKYADGDTGNVGLAVTGAVPNGGVATTIDVTLDYQPNANGANIQLHAIVVSATTKEAKDVTTATVQSVVTAALAVDTIGYDSPTIFLYWYDTVAKQASSSVFAYVTP